MGDDRWLDEVREFVIKRERDGAGGYANLVKIRYVEYDKNGQEADIKTVNLELPGAVARPLWRYIKGLVGR